MIGSSLVRKLIKNNFEVVIIDNLWRGNLENLHDSNGPVLDLTKCFYNIDISDTQNIERIKNVLVDVDVVIHLADIVAGIGYVFNNQYEILVQNQRINSNLFRSTLGLITLKKLIYVGTACSFPLELQNSPDSILYDRDLFPANPESAYGWSKLFGQLELKYLKEIVDFEISTLMLHNVYGERCEYDHPRSQVIPSLINQAIDSSPGDDFVVWGTGKQGRAFVYVDDVVDALTRAIKTENLPEYMQIGPSHGTTIRELAKTIIKISNKDLNLHFDTSKPEGDKGRCADNSVAKEILGWVPMTTLEKGLNNTFNWIKAQKEND